MNMEVNGSVRVSEGPDGIDRLEVEIQAAVSGMIQQIRGESSGLTLLRFERMLMRVSNRTQIVLLTYG